MKKKFNKKSLCLAAAALALTAGISVNSAMAYFTTYTTAAGDVTISLGSTVTIPEEKLERIFDQFFRLDSARATRSGGAGLGLAIAKEIVELHGGTISAESSDGQVTFTVVL